MMKKSVSLLLTLTLVAGLFEARAETAPTDSVALEAQAVKPDLYHTYPNDIAINYGVASVQTFVSLVAETMMIIPTAIGGMQFDGFHSTGSIGVSYYRSLGKTVSVGGVVNYNRVFSNFHDKNDPAITGKFAMNWVVVMAAAKFYWFKKPSVAMYSKVGLGAGMLINRFTKKEADGTRSASPLTVGWAPAAQLSAVGVEFGGRVRGFAELGLGMEGVLNLGVKYYL